jgi:cell division transport system ATP-binding protein
MYGVTKVYASGAEALRGVDLSIDKGEFVFVVGPSGAGKSTLLAMVYRGMVPTQGQVWVAGRNIVRLRWREVPLFRRRIGVVFQDFKLLPDRSVYDNVAFAMEVIEASRRDIAKRVPLALDMVGLAHKAQAMPGELAGGEQQRAAIARAIVNDPLIVIADEPTGNLDPDTSMDIMNLLCDINLRGTTVIMATHNQLVVDRLRRRVVHLEDGVVVRDELRGGYCLEA